MELAAHQGLQHAPEGGYDGHGSDISSLLQAVPFQRIGLFSCHACCTASLLVNS